MLRLVVICKRERYRKRLLLGLAEEMPREWMLAGCENLTAYEKTEAVEPVDCLLIEKKWIGTDAEILAWTKEREGAGCLVLQMSEEYEDETAIFMYQPVDVIAERICKEYQCFCIKKREQKEREQKEREQKEREQKERTQQAFEQQAYEQQEHEEKERGQQAYEAAAAVQMPCCLEEQELACTVNGIWPLQGDDTATSYALKLAREAAAEKKTLLVCLGGQPETEHGVLGERAELSEVLYAIREYGENWVQNAAYCMHTAGKISVMNGYAGLLDGEWFGPDEIRLLLRGIAALGFEAVYLDLSGCICGSRLLGACDHIFVTGAGDGERTETFCRQAKACGIWECVELCPAEEHTERKGGRFSWKSIGSSFGAG